MMRASFSLGQAPPCAEQVQHSTRQVTAVPAVAEVQWKSYVIMLYSSVNWTVKCLGACSNASRVSNYTSSDSYCLLIVSSMVRCGSGALRHKNMSPHLRHTSYSSYYLLDNLMITAEALIQVCGKAEYGIAMYYYTHGTLAFSSS